MNQDKCKDCTEPTKHVSGFYDGVDPQTGNEIRGVIFDCLSTTCPIRLEAIAAVQEAIGRRQAVIEENRRNGIDMKRVRAGRRRVGISTLEMAQCFGISPSEYSAYENERKPFPVELSGPIIRLISDQAEREGQG